MKKRYFPLLLIFALCMYGCAVQQTDSPAKTPSPDTDICENVTEESISTEAEGSVSPDGNAYGITVTEQTDSSSYFATDDPSACVLTASAVYPYISITGKTDASQKINDAIRQELDTFLVFEKENAAYAEESRKFAIENEGKEPDPYTAEFTYQLKRCDDRIISVIFSQSDYTGGAHGNYWSYGITFDTATGMRLYLGSLCESSEAFLKMLSDELSAQAALPAYERYIDKNIAVDLEEAFLKNSTCWYLDRSGLSFISNPYVLGAYAAGTFEFNIPYKELNGLKEGYAYKGGYIRKIFPGISVQYDINSNGTTDEICYYVATDEDFSNPHPVLTVNGTDFSGEFDKLYMTGPLSDAYYLIDVDPDDPYIEIAVTNQNEKNPDGTCTHFFRYTSEKKLLYQGKVPGVFDESMQVRYNANGNLVLSL